MAHLCYKRAFGDFRLPALGDVLKRRDRVSNVAVFILDWGATTLNWDNFVALMDFYIIYGPAIALQSS